MMVVSWYPDRCRFLTVPLKLQTIHLNVSLLLHRPICFPSGNIVLAIKTMARFTGLQPAVFSTYVFTNAVHNRLCPYWPSLADMLTGTHMAPSYRYALVFRTIDSGCLLNCLPLFLSRRLAAVVAAYLAGDRALIAASGRYLSPATLDFLPDLVRHFCLPHIFKLCCG